MNEQQLIKAFLSMFEGKEQQIDEADLVSLLEKHRALLEDRRRSRVRSLLDALEASHLTYKRTMLNFLDTMQKYLVGNLSHASLEKEYVDAKNHLALQEGKFEAKLLELYDAESVLIVYHHKGIPWTVQLEAYQYHYKVRIVDEDEQHLTLLATRPGSLHSKIVSRSVYEDNPQLQWESVVRWMKEEA